MKNDVLIELADRWERDAIAPENEDGSPEAERGNVLCKGQRKAKRECADALRTLISIIG